MKYNGQPILWLKQSLLTIILPGIIFSAFSDVLADSITITKDATPDDPQDFAYTATGTGVADFSLDDDTDGTLSNTQTFTGLSDGTYSFTETTVTDWTLAGVSCTGAVNSTVTTGSSGVSIDLSNGEDISCTFYNNNHSCPSGQILNLATITANEDEPTYANNTAEACLEVSAIGSLQITKAVTGGSDPQSFSLQLDCSDDAFDDSTISLTDGQSHSVSNIPAGTSCTVTETTPTAPAGYSYAGAQITPAQTVTIYNNAISYITVTNPLVASCTLSASVNVLACVDPGTPADSSDDYYQFELTVDASNSGASTGYHYRSEDAGVLGYNLPYGTEVQGPYVIESTDSPLNLDIVDSLDSACTTSVSGLTEPATCSAGAPDLTITKLASVTEILSGETFTYTLQASNLSSSVDAANVAVADLLPAGVSYQSQSGDGSYDDNTGIWTIGDLPATESRSITITVQAD